MSFWPNWREHSFFFVTLNLLLVSLILMALAQAGQSFYEAKQVGKPQPLEHTIYVEGEGKVTIVPDLATVTLGVETSAESVEAAQAENSRVMNGLSAEIKALGIDAKDLQTQYYSVYEDEYWNPETGEYISTGWIVSQQLAVKVRDTAKVSDVLSVAGKNGVTNIYGPDFSVDDPESQLEEARKEAIADARMKAQTIAASLGVTLGDVVGYSEYSGGDVYYRDMYMETSAAEAPSIESGSEELSLTISATYLIE